MGSLRAVRRGGMVAAGSLPAPPPAHPRRLLGRRDLLEVVSACAGGAVLTGWALHLGCSPLVLALLSATPFLGQLAHLPARRVALGEEDRRRE